MDRLVSDLPDLIDGLQVLDLERSPNIGSEERPDLVAQVRGRWDLENPRHRCEIEGRTPV